jgi:predicted permease
VSGVPLPSAVRLFGELLGNAAGPCALFALGLFLAGQPLRDDLRLVGWLVVLKLVVQPAATWVLAFRLLVVEPVWAEVAVLLNALPVGAGAFVLAQQYGRQVARTSAAILISTVLSVLTISYLLAAFVP